MIRKATARCPALRLSGNGNVNSAAWPQITLSRRGSEMAERRLEPILRSQIGKLLEVFGNPSGIINFRSQSSGIFMSGTATEIIVGIL